MFDELKRDAVSTEVSGRRPLRSGLFLAALLGVWIGASAWTFHTGKGTSYFQDDPQACVNCHIMRDQYASWQKSSHHAWATCNACHVPHNFWGKWYTKAENGLRHSWMFTFGGFPEPIQARPVSRAILEQNCRDCHQSLIRALLGEQPARHPAPHGDDCLRCHRHVGHGANW